MANITKCKSILAALGLGLVLSSGAANAITYFPPITGFEDDDLDWVFDNNNNGIIDVGDDLVSVIEINQTFAVGGGASADIFPDELTGIVELRVTTANPDGSLVFGAMPGGQLSGDEVMALWLDPTPDLDVVGVNCGSLAECSALAMDGDLFEIDSLIAANGDFWQSSAPFIPGGTDIATVAGTPATTTVAFFNYDTTITFNGSGQALGPDMTGSGSILGGQGLTNGAIARSDFQFQKTHVPEPGSVALLAIGLMGFGFAYRKHQRQQH